MRVLINNWDNLSWNRILLQLDKVGPKTAQKILEMVTAQDKPIQALGEYKTTAKWKGPSSGWPRPWQPWIALT